MKISQEVREYANSNTAGDVDQAIDKGMAEMAQEYNEQGRKLYHKVLTNAGGAMTAAGSSFPVQIIDHGLQARLCQPA